ncbi:amidohydrolase family protein [Solirhodobacter olei]|uniref:amidohydrolase family protein n=1 Tax=Solirhodobacter olei TaxID=2493082 RepID=UPI003BAD5328
MLDARSKTLSEGCRSLCGDQRSEWKEQEEGCEPAGEGDQISMFAPWIRSIPVRVLIDHCGRPSPDAGLAQPGFTALLDLAQTERVRVKVSGYSKFFRQRFRRRVIIIVEGRISGYRSHPAAADKVSRCWHGSGRRNTVPSSHERKTCPS